MIEQVTQPEYPDLVSVWESSVKATHDFLKPEDFYFYRDLVPTFFDQVTLHCIKNETGRMVGFIGTNNESLEMLFVAASEIGKGLGKKLLLFAMGHLGVTKLDVNRDNLQATAFYSHFGFEIKSESELDGFEKPYPVLHMELKKN
jgi:putative acetyltransferase